jgi:hypothetical protein
LEALEFRVGFDREKGSFPGKGGGCEAIASDGEWSFGADLAEKRLNANFEATTMLQTPAKLAECTYVTISDPVLPEDFAITIGPFDAMCGGTVPVVEVTEIVCQQCGIPKSGRATPAASDALICLRNAVGQDVDLLCPPCGGLSEE